MLSPQDSLARDLRKILRRFTPTNLAKEQAQRAADAKALEEETAKQLTSNATNVSFREEVIEELVAHHGKARHVAANLTNTEPKLLQVAKDIGYI